MNIRNIQTFIFILAMTGMMFLSSCNKTAEQVNEFLSQLQAASNLNDKEAIARLYPNAAEADSLAIHYVADSVKISDDGDNIIVEIGNGADLSLRKDENGNFQAVSSHGVFVYPANILDFAKTTGQYKPTLNDAENAKRMADTTFTAFMREKIKKQLLDGLKIVSERATGYEDGPGDDLYPTGYIVVVKNISNFPIPGSAYEVIITERWCDDFYGRTGYIQHPQVGVDLAPDEQHTFPYRKRGDSYSAKLKIKASDDLFSTYKGSGDEYDNYLNR